MADEGNDFGYEIKPGILKTEEMMVEVAHKIEETFPGMGFCLMSFNFNDAGGASNYISNGKMEDIILALRELADRLEKKETIGRGAGGVH